MKPRHVNEVLTDPAVLAGLCPDVIIDPESVVERMVSHLNLDPDGDELPALPATVPTKRIVYVTKWLHGRQIQMPRLVIVSSNARRNPAADVYPEVTPS